MIFQSLWWQSSATRMMPTQSKCQQYDSSEISLEIISNLAFEELGQRPFRCRPSHCPFPYINDMSIVMPITSPTSWKQNPRRLESSLRWIRGSCYVISTHLPKTVTAHASAINTANPLNTMCWPKYQGSQWNAIIWYLREIYLCQNASADDVSISNTKP